VEVVADYVENARLRLLRRPPRPREGSSGVVGPVRGDQRPFGLPRWIGVAERDDGDDYDVAPVRNWDLRILYSSKPARICS